MQTRGLDAGSVTLSRVLQRCVVGGQGSHSTSFLFGVQQWQRIGPAVCRHYRPDEEVEGVGKTSSLLRSAGNPAGLRRHSAVPPDLAVTITNAH